MNGNSTIYAIDDKNVRIRDKIYTLQELIDDFTVNNLSYPELIKKYNVSESALYRFFNKELGLKKTKAQKTERAKKRGKCYTDGRINVFADKCPDGFQPGQTVRHDRTKCKHYTNGTENVFCEVCPKGFWPGMTQHKTERKKPDRANVHWYTDGKNNVHTANPPEGYRLGMTRKNGNPTKGKPSKEILKLAERIDKTIFEEKYYSRTTQQVADFFNTNRHLVLMLGDYFGLSRQKQKQASWKANVERLKKQNKDPAMNKKRVESLKIACQEKYGQPYGGRAVQLLKSDVSEEFKKMFFDLNESLAFLKKHNKEFTKEDLENMFNCSENTLNNWLYSSGNKEDLFQYIKHKSGTSDYEQEIADCFPSVKFIRDYRDWSKTVDRPRGLEIDLYAPDYKIGIEFNGTYWHSSEVKPKNYHQEKSKLAEQHGIRLIHIYEYEWNNPAKKEKIIQRLNIAFHLNITKIYARQCEIKQISNQEAKILNEAIHLQGHRDAQVTYGLFYQNKLVQLMSFSKTKYNRNLTGDNDWEIIRGCPGSNNIVVGGVEKLFTHFIRDYNPNNIFSYCDFNKFDGKSYEAIGMKFIGYTEPEMKWIMPDGSVINRNPKKHAELKAKAKFQLFGAGSKKYLWTKEK